MRALTTGLLLAAADLPALAKWARSALAAPVRTVGDRTHPSPSGDPHDYVS
jgi:hypothetical protein